VDCDARAGCRGFQGVEPISHRPIKGVERGGIRLDMVASLGLILRRRTGIKVLEGALNPCVKRVVLGARLAQILGEPKPQVRLFPEGRVER
jgi:hypothetical protein